MNPHESPLAGSARDGLYLYDTIAVSTHIAELTENGELETTSDAASNQRLRLLTTMATSSAWRDFIQPSEQMVAAVRQLKASAPNLEPLFKEVERALALALMAEAGLQVPPMLLVGPPGVGKTWAVRRLSTVLRTTHQFVAMNTLSDAKSILCGLNPFWSRARTGLIARALLDASTTSPILVLDEVDKVSALTREQQPLDFLHSLLEPENARIFQDEFLDVALRCDRIIWLLTANDVSVIPRSILDRLVVLHVDAPDADGLRQIIRSMFADANAALDDCFEPDLPDDGIGFLTSLNPRRAKQALRSAMGIAALEGRRSISVGDIRQAAEEVSAQLPSSARAIGFTSSPRGGSRTHSDR